MEAHEFRGVIGRYHWESTPWWPDQRRPPANAPNIVLIVLDDVGFAQLGCFGSDIDTPVIDGLAARGLRYSNFHTTALCSPTRSCLLTGRNHHANGMGRIVELASGFPGYDGRIARANGFLPEMLVPQGYAAWAVGKWHLTPEDEGHLAAPRHRWPLGRGFERFYGFFQGETHQFDPALIYDNHQVEPPGRYDEGYHLTNDLVDHAVEFIRDLRSIDVDKPFFLYFCTGACHSPHQSPPEWVERYRGRFDDGWDLWREATLARQIASGLLAPGTELSPRPEWVPAWDTLSADERRLYARFMEAFAGFLSHTDDQLGRLLACLEQTGDTDNTLVLLLSDNGASSEGGPRGSVNDLRLWNWSPSSLKEALARIDEIGGPRCHNNYPWGWTVAGNTPFRRWKREVHEGGVADPLIVSWPRRIPAGGDVRRQYVHAIDIAPTVLEATGVTAPAVIDGVEQRALHGVSFAYTFAAPGAEERHTTQYYEMFGCRGLYHEGWKAVTYHPIQATEPGLDHVGWELYHVTEDPSECHDLASSHQELLQELVERWWVEAARFDVLPLDNRPFSEFVLDRPVPIPPRHRYVYYPGSPAVPEVVAANVRNRSHLIAADVMVPDGGVEGVLISQGSLLGGWTFYVKDGALHYEHSYVGLERHRISAPATLAPGHHTLAFRFTKTAEHAGTGALLVDDAVIGEGPIPRFTPTRFSLTGAGLSCGRDPGLPVSDDYRSPFPFSGTLVRVTVEVDGQPFVDPEGEALAAVTTQ